MARTYAKTIIVFFMVLIVAPMSAESISSLLDSLDASLSHREEYEKLRTDRIEDLQRLYNSTTAFDVKYEILNHIYDEYKSFNFDSASVYGYKCLDLAMRMGNADDEAWARCNIAFAYISAGESLEVQPIMSVIDPSTLSDKTRTYYYYIGLRFWQREASGSLDNELYQQYMERSDAYIDSLLMLTEKGSPDYWKYSGVRYARHKEYEKALECYNNVLRNDNINVHDKAVLYSNMAWANDGAGNNDEAMKCFIRSAIYDNESATREITSLYWVARKLVNRGDWQRAIKYMYVALDDVRFYNSSQRRMEISDLLAEIETERYAIVQAHKKTTTTAVVLVTVLLIILGITLLFIRKKRKHINERLNAEREQRRILEEVNRKLDEANKTKIDYLGQLMYSAAEEHIRYKKLCSSIERQLTTRQYGMIHETVSAQQVDEAAAKLYTTFDEMFLTVFPNFIEKYNALFEEKDQQHPEEENTLTMEMRIFALIRLGITNSEKISNFLNYSVHTINTYKTRVKNKSIVDNEQFEQLICEI